MGLALLVLLFAYDSARADYDIQANSSVDYCSNSSSISGNILNCDDCRAKLPDGNYSTTEIDYESCRSDKITCLEKFREVPPGQWEKISTTSGTLLGLQFKCVSSEAESVEVQQTDPAASVVPNPDVQTAEVIPPMVSAPADADVSFGSSSGQIAIHCEFGKIIKENDPAQCDVDKDFVKEIRDLAKTYVGYKKWLKTRFTNLGTSSSVSQQAKPDITIQTVADADDKFGEALAERSYLTRGSCPEKSSDCLMITTKFSEDDAGAKGVTIAQGKIKSISGQSGSVSSSKYPSETFAQCVKVFGGDNPVKSRQTNDTAWFKTASLPSNIGTLAIELNQEIDSPDTLEYIRKYGETRKALIAKLKIHPSASSEQAKELINELEKKDQNHEKWMEYLNDRVKIGAADLVTTFLRSCDAAFYLTSFEDPFVEEAEEKHTSGQGAYGIITCKNPSPVYTQDYGYCVNVANAYDVYTVMEVAAKQGSQIAGQAVIMTGQAQAMSTAAVNPTDPTLQLFELKKQAQASAYTATGESVIQAAMGAYLGTVAKKFWTLEDFVNKCDEQLPRNSIFTGSVYQSIIGGDGTVKDCITPDSCRPDTVPSSPAKGSSYVPKREQNSIIVLHELFLKSWDFIKATNEITEIHSDQFLFEKLYASDRDKAKPGDPPASKEEATISWGDRLAGDAKVSSAVTARTDGENRAPAAPDPSTGDCSGLESTDYKKYFCLQVMSYDHCSVAANDLIGAGTLAPNDHVKALAQGMATQALAKTLVSGAAAAAFYVQAANVQKMIDGINDKMDGVDMAGINADLLTIQECQMNPSLPQCGGLGFADGTVGFGSGFGSISMDAGSSSTMGSTSSNDSATSDDASATSDTGESLSGTGAFQSFAGTDADEAMASRAGIKDSSASGGGSGGGAGSSPGAPGGSGGGKSPGAAGGGGQNSFGKNLSGTFGIGGGSTWGGGTGKKSSTGLDDALKGGTRSGSVLDYRGPAGIGDDSVDIWKRISKGYNKAVTNKRLLEYVDE